MKKFIVTIMTIILMFSLIACGDKETEEQPIDAKTDVITNDTEEQETDLSVELDEVTVNDEFPYVLIINDVRYEFPISYDEFLSRGWMAEEAEEIGESMMSPDSSGAFFSGGAGHFYNGEIYGAWPLFVNTDMENEKMFKDCPIVGFSFDDRAEEWNYPVGSISIEGPNGTLTIGESVESDVYDFFNGDGFYLEDNGSIFITCDEEQGVITEISYMVKF